MYKEPKSRTQGALRKKKCAFARNPDAPVRTSDYAWCVLTPEMRKAPDVNCPAVLELLMKSNPIACCLTALMSLLCICWYAINTWHKVVAIDGLPTHVHRPYVLSCFCVSTQEKNRARIPASFTCTRITYAPGLLIKKYHRWGKSTLPQRWRLGHSIGRLLTPMVFGADFASKALQVRSPRGSAEVEHLEHFASFKGDGLP